MKLCYFRRIPVWFNLFCHVNKSGKIAWLRWLFKNIDYDGNLWDFKNKLKRRCWQIKINLLQYIYTVSAVCVSQSQLSEFTQCPWVFMPMGFFIFSQHNHWRYSSQKDTYALIRGIVSFLFSQIISYPVKQNNIQLKPKSNPLWELSNTPPTANR